MKKNSGKKGTSIDGPIRLNPDNPHYYLFRGKPTILVGSGEHYGAVINSAFDYDTYFNELQNKNLNLTRLFTGPYTEIPGDFGITENTLAPDSETHLFPWARSAVSGYSLGGNKFDLNTWDTAYWNRLKDFVDKAGQKGVVVSIALFCVLYEDSAWNNSPLNASNNVQETGTCGKDDVYTLNAGASLLQAQDEYVRKIVIELRDYDNVIYEVINEPYTRSNVSADWQNHMISLIKSTESSFAYSHLIAVNVANGNTNVEDPYPDVSVYYLHYNSSGSVRDNYAINKVIGCDETGFSGSSDETYREQAWEFIVGGGAHFDHLDYSFSVSHPDGTLSGYSSPGGGSPELRTSYKALLSFMNSFDFINMRPDDSVLVNVSGRTLVNPGNEYAIYFSSLTTDPLINLPEGSYAAEWVDPLNGGIIYTETITEHHGGIRVIAKPSISTPDVALSIRGLR